VSIQNIIDKAETISISRSKISGSTISRGGRLRSALVASNQPYMLTVNYAQSQSYTDNRAMMEELDKLDLIHNEDVDIGSTNTNLSWLVDYQGALSTAQIGQLKLSGTYAGNTVDIETEDVTGSSSTDIMFKKGDYITFDNGYRYPYTVTADVTIGAVTAGSNVSVPVSRPIIVQDGYTFNDSKGVLVGPDVTWRVRMTEKPSFTVIPSRYIDVSGAFVFMEVIG
tara:strand:+ start:6600 stop:7274 length:675 start_codon:yes stop_codon:yes gene_type:complete